MSFQDVRHPLSDWTRAGARCAVATLVGVRRSAPRPPGARFAVTDRGDVAGSISSGCVEADLQEHMLQALDAGEPRLVQYGISDEMAHGVGLACGGEIDVLISEHDAADPAWRRLEEIAGSRAAAVLCMVISGAGTGRRLLVEADGSRTGGLGSSSADEHAAESIGDLLEHGGSRTFERPDGAGEVFAEAFLPARRLAIVGATPVAAALCHLASFAGFEVYVVEPREGLLRPGWFGEAAGVIHEWPESGLIGVGLDPYVSVVALAHEERLDVPALSAALRAGSGYIGLLGGRRTQRLRAESLARAGFEPAEIARVHGPTGLDIGAETPEEIAVSILAEMLAVQRGAVS